MHVYEIVCTFYVTADNVQDAHDVLDQAIAPYSPENLVDQSDPSIDVMYFDQSSDTEYAPSH